MSKSFSAFSFALLLAPALAAQNQVWVVDVGAGPGADFTAIDPAVQAAADGDVVLVRGGTYASFAVDAKAVAVVADAGANVTVQGTVVVRNLGFQQTVELRGLSLQDWPLLPPVLSLRDSVGRIWIEDCAIDGVSAAPEPLGTLVDVVQCPDVAFQRCTLRGGALGFGGAGCDAIRIDEARVLLLSCTVEGGSSPGLQVVATWPGRDAVSLSSGSAFLYACSVTGGRGRDGTFVGANCSPGMAGGAGLSAAEGALFTHIATTFAGGAGGTGGAGLFGPCPDGPDGAPLALAPTSTQIALSGAAHSFSLSSPVREGLTATGSIQAAPPGALAFLLVSVDAFYVEVPALLGAIVVSPVGLAILPLGPTDASGALPLAFAIPSLAAGNDIVRIFTQSLLFDATRGLTLGPGSTLHVLDAAF